MLTSLTLTNFRGFTELVIPKLARVNLIGGVNNAGKTAILEAIYLLLERHPTRIDNLPSLFRARTDVDNQKYFWDWISKDRDDRKPTIVTGGVAPNSTLKLFWTLNNSPRPKDVKLTQVVGRNVLCWAFSSDAQPDISVAVEAFSPRPTSPVEDAQVYTKVLQKSLDNEERMEALLREIDPRVKLVRALSDPQSNKPLLHIGLDSGATFPATQLGQGFNRLLRIYAAMLFAEAEVFLIDEVETGLHHSILPTVWKGLAAVARQENVQIFATTHSREAILAAHRVFSAEAEYDFAYHRLERDAKGEVHAVTYDQEALAGADEANFELR